MCNKLMEPSASRILIVAEEREAESDDREEMIVVDHELVPINLGAFKVILLDKLRMS